MTDYGAPGQNLETVNVDGLRFTINRLAAGRFVGFVKALIGAGYRPKVIGGYRANAGPTLSGANVSNHQLGLAIDIDPAQNPFVRGGTAPYALPPNVGQIATKYGLVWGGDYRSGKDYMHFEAADAPYTPKRLSAGGTSSGTGPTQSGILPSIPGVSTVTNALSTGARDLVLTGAFVVGGLALVVLGFYRGVQPAVQKVAQVTGTVGKAAA